MDGLIEIYTFISSNKEIIDKLTSVNEEYFIKDSDSLNIAYGLIKNLENSLTKLERTILITNDYLMKMSKELFYIDKYLTNVYMGINGYLIYDFFKIEYKELVSEIEKLMI